MSPSPLLRVHWWLYLLLVLPFLAQAADPLPSWSDGPSRHAIMTFVGEVTSEGSKGFVPPAERIAVFDNDGTLWSEQPLYIQLAFAMDEVKRLAPQHPEWKEQQPFKAVLENDLKTLFESGMPGLLEVVSATHAGLDTDALLGNARAWLARAVHPRTHRPYTEMVYQPMLELLDYLRANGFKTYIVSGGDVVFMRAFAEEVYGIPPEQVIGTHYLSRFQDQGGRLSVLRTPQLAHNNDGPGKVESIELIIGRRPLFAFGNSDGDLQMLQWTAAGSGKRFAGLVHHTDAQRETAYDRDSSIGHLDKALDIAKADGWTVVDMAAEWRQVFPFSPTTSGQ